MKILGNVLNTFWISCGVILVVTSMQNGFAGISDPKTQAIYGVTVGLCLIINHFEDFWRGSAPFSS